MEIDKSIIKAKTDLTVKTKTLYKAYLQLFIRKKQNRFFVFKKNISESHGITFKVELA